MVNVDKLNVISDFETILLYIVWTEEFYPNDLGIMQHDCECKGTVWGIKFSGKFDNSEYEIVTDIDGLKKLKSVLDFILQFAEEYRQ